MLKRLAAFGTSSSSSATNTTKTSNPPETEKALNFSPSKALSQQSGAAQLAPLQCMTSIPEKNVIEFLQLADAQSLMLTCKDMHSAVLKFFWLHREIASSPQVGGLDAKIAQLSPSKQALAP